MQYTLLEMVRHILSSMDSDEVGSWDETTESAQVSETIRSTFFELRNRGIFPDNRVVHSLQMYLQPTVGQLESNYIDIEWIKYDCATAAQTAEGNTNYRTLQYLPIKEFIDRSDRLGANIAADTTVEEVNFSNFLDFSTPYYVQNNAPPRYYTSHEDYFLMFDAYDSAVDTLGLVEHKFKVYSRFGQNNFDLSNDLVFGISDPMYQLLLNEAKATCWLELKQTQNAKAEQWAKRGWNQVQKHKQQIKGLSDFETLPNYGRKGCYYG